ncbi:MAG: N-acetyl-gamma-glutamyl-phosphate reductase [Planctomycetota bacterium]
MTGPVPAVPVTIVGVRGYTGQELVRLLAGHPAFELAALFGSERTEPGTPIDAVAPAVAPFTTLDVGPGDVGAIIASGAKAVFLATPHDASAALAPELVDAGLTVFDLSGAFRLAPDDYPAWYGFDHPAPAHLGRAVYGLVEHARDKIASADLVALPGCYPTASLLAIKPLVDSGRIDTSRDVIIDAISGVSGAGRKASEATSFCEIGPRAYGVLAHRHAPEIERHAGTRVRFVAHLGPWKRGILATIHADLGPGETVGSTREFLGSVYAEHALVRVLPAGQSADVGRVERTSFAEISIGGDDERGALVISVAIDNLLKGASGQAVQAANLRFGLPELAGLGASPGTASGTEVAHA